MSDDVHGLLFAEAPVAPLLQLVSQRPAVAELNDEYLEVVILEDVKQFYEIGAVALPHQPGLGLDQPLPDGLYARVRLLPGLLLVQ